MIKRKSSYASVIRSTICIFLMVFTGVVSQGQKLVHQTTDTGSFVYSNVEDAIYYDGSWLIGVNTKKAEGFVPSIIRMDTSGKTLWNSAWLETPFYIADLLLNKMMLSVDGFLYVIWQPASEDLQLIWKINPKTGQRIWSKQVYNVDAYTCRFNIHDIDSTRLLILRQNSFNLGVVNGSVIGFYVDRFTGTFSQEYVLTRTVSQTALAAELDHQKNLIVTSKDTVFKYYGPNLDSLIWVSPYHGANINYFTHAITDSASNRVVLAGYGKYGNWENGILVNLNLSTGATDSFRFTGSYYKCIKLKKHNGHVYSTWRVPLTNTQSMLLIKTKLSDFSLKWNFSHVINSSGNAINDFCFDSSGNVYGTGHYRDGNWFIIKLRDSNASILCTQTFTLDTSRWSGNSRGRYICYLNNRLYALGDMQYMHINQTMAVGYYRPALVVMDTSCKSEKIKLLESLTRTNTSVIQILNSPTGEATVLAKVGNGLELTRYDSSLQVKWKNKIYSGQHLFSGSIYEDKSGGIGLTCYSRKFYEHYPYYQIYQDTLIFYQYSSSGTFKSKKRYHTGSFDYRPFDVLMDTGKAVVFSKNDSFFNWHITTPTSLGSPNGSGFKVDTMNLRFRYSYNLNDSFAILIGRTTGNARVYRLNKYNGQTQVQDTLPSVLWHINQVIFVDSSTLLIGGFSQSGKASSALYDFTLKDTLWTKVIFPQNNSKVILGDLDTVNAVAYLAVQKGNSGAIIAQNLNNGSIRWIRDFTGFDSGFCGITDLRFNHYAADINISGYETNSIEGIARMMRFDTAGKILADYRMGYRELANNRANTIGVMADSSAWFGGQKQNAIEGSFGFIYELNNCLHYRTDTLSSCAPIVSPSGNEIYYQSGWYIDTVDGVQSCDTLIHILANIRSNGKHIMMESCDSVVSPSSRYSWKISGLYHDTLQNAQGCDSILTIRVTVLPSKLSSVTWSACDSIRSPGNTYWWYQTGIYYDTLSTAKGCDSIIEVHLTIRSTTYSYLNWVACDSVLSPGSNYVWKNSGIFYDTLVNLQGCDSIIEVNLLLHTKQASTFNLTVCDSMMSPSQKYVWTQSGIYRDTISTLDGCDSMLEIRLTILKDTMSFFQVTSCNSYLSPSGKYLWTQSGSYKDTLIASTGCDSFLNIQVQINYDALVGVSVTSCDSFVAPGGIKVWKTSGTYYDTLVGSKGCDSVVRVDLTIFPTTTAKIIEHSCYFFVSPSSKYTWTQSGIYYDTLINSAGCDSLIEIELFIHDRDSSHRVLASCKPQLALNGQYWYNSTGVYRDTLINSYGCDSVVHTNFVLAAAIPRSLLVNACSTYVSPYSGKSYSQSGTYSDTVVYPSTCDTAYTYLVTIHTIDNGVVDSNRVLYSRGNGLQYQWLDCNSNWSPINAAIGQTYIPTVNGNYAVEVSDAYCIDTSSCVSVVWVGFSKVLSGSVQIYPNPSDGVFQVSCTGNINFESIRIYSMNGSLCWEEEAQGQHHVIDTYKNLVKGVYLIQILLDKGIHHQLIQIY